MTHTHNTAPTRFIEAAGIRFAYRRLGAANGTPLVFLQHFTGTMDNWDPSVVDGFARERSVILFDNVGVSRLSGETPTSIGAMATDAVTFITALGLARIDLLGFSLGGFVAQLFLFVQPTESSQRAGRAFIARQALRQADRDPDVTEQTFSAQLEAIVAWGSSRSEEAATRLQRITQPVLVVNGTTDVMVPTPNSYRLFQQLPNARAILYPDSGHGALFQYADDFVAAGLQFLADESIARPFVGAAALPFNDC